MRFFISSCTDQRRLALFTGYSSLPTSITLVRLKSFDYVVFQFYIGRSWTETEKKGRRLQVFLPTAETC